MRNEKRGVAHVEMVISYGIFVLFTFWLIIYLNPIRHQDISNVLIDGLERSFIANASLEVIEMPVKLQPVGNCFKIKNPFNTTDMSNMIIKDRQGNLVNFILSPGNVTMNNNGDFYKIYYSETQFNSQELTQDPLTCVNLNLTQFNYTSPRTLSPLLATRIERIKLLYYSNYDTLKTELNYPLTYDFTVNITDFVTKQNLFEMKIKKPGRVEVIARETPIDLIQSDGTITKAIMNMQVW